MKTIIDTHGKVIQTGDQGVQVVSESGIPLLVIGEVSDDTVTNVFLTMEKADDRSIPLHPVGAAYSQDWEIRIPKNAADDPKCKRCNDTGKVVACGDFTMTDCQCRTDS